MSPVFAKNGLVERKVNPYPIGSADIDGIPGQAPMITDTRGDAIQEVLVPNGAIPNFLNEAGPEILGKCRTIGKPLDTISYTGPQGSTHYFP